MERYMFDVVVIGGGVIGGLFHLALSFMGNAGSAIIYIATFLICSVILFNISVIQLFTSIKDAILKKIAAAKASKEKKEEAAPSPSREYNSPPCPEVSLLLFLEGVREWLSYPSIRILKCQAPAFSHPLIIRP